MPQLSPRALDKDGKSKLPTALGFRGEKEGSASELVSLTLLKPGPSLQPKGLSLPEPPCCPCFHGKHSPLDLLNRPALLSVSPLESKSPGGSDGPEA